MARILTRLSFGMLSIPITFGVMKTLPCEGVWLSTSWKCYSAWQHLSLFGLSIAVLLCFIPMLVMGTHTMHIVLALHCAYPRACLLRACCEIAERACSVNRNPFADGYAHAAHGRVDIAVTTVQLCLSFVYTFGVQFERTFMVVVTVLSALALLYIHLTQAPHYAFAVNRFNSAAVFIYAWATLCLVMITIRGRAEVRRLVGCAALCWTDSLAFLCGMNWLHRIKWKRSCLW